MPTEPAPSQSITRFRGSHVYAGTKLPTELRHDVTWLHAAQRGRRARRARLLGIGIGGFVATPLGLVAAAATDRALLLAVAGVALVVGITAVVARARCHPYDEARITTLDALARLLATDMRPDAPFRVHLDLRPPHDRSKFVRAGNAGAWKVRYFVDPWLLLAGRMLDGTTFQLRLTAHHQERSKTKRSASGKYKTKRKAKASHRARLRLTVKPERYRGLAALVAAQRGRGPTGGLASEVRLPEPARVTRLDFDDTVLQLVVDLGADAGKATPPLHHATAMMFLGLYRVLNLARATAKPQSLGDTP